MNKLLVVFMAAIIAEGSMAYQNSCIEIGTKGAIVDSPVKIEAKATVRENEDGEEVIADIEDDFDTFLAKMSKYKLENISEKEKTTLARLYYQAVGLDNKNRTEEAATAWNELLNSMPA
ncbi:MAG: hypothetical protein WCR27_07045 [Eubacteriales bacterium]